MYLADEDPDKFNIEKISLDNTLITGDLEASQLVLAGLMQRVATGEYQELRGELYAVNQDNRTVDIVNFSLENSHHSKRGYVGQERINLHNELETNLLFERLNNTAGTTVRERSEGGYMVSKGYEQFSIDVAILMTDEINEED